MAEKGTSNRGFGSMHEEKQRDIGSSGGHEAHQKGAALSFHPKKLKKQDAKAERLSVRTANICLRLDGKAANVLTKVTRPKSISRKVSIPTNVTNNGIMTTRLAAGLLSSIHRLAVKP
jgi:hypothetical protein